MPRLYPDEHAARRALGSSVHFIRDKQGVPVRAVINHRWANSLEWIAIRKAGIPVAAKMTPPPERAHREPSCPCAGCGRCACAWVVEGRQPCRRTTCICPRRRAPVRLAIYQIDPTRAELLLRRGDTVLCCLGTWTQERGWDFTAAGDAKARSLPGVIHLVIARDIADQVGAGEVAGA